MRYAIALTIVCVCLLASMPAHAVAPDISASSAILYEPVTEQILLAKDSDARMKSASLVKIMTMYVAYEALAAGEISKDDPVTVSEKAWRTGGSTMFLEVGDVVTVGQLIRGIAVVSGNDACVALAQHIAGSEDAFVNRMNATASTLGMNDTRYANSHGLDDPEHYTTARDIAVLSSALIRRHPEAMVELSIKEFEYDGIEQPNRNNLLWIDERVDGLKTGYTGASGYSFAVSAQEEDLRLVAVILGADGVATREAEASALLQWGFVNFTTITPISQGERIDTVRVWQGRQSEVTAVSLETITATVPVAERDQVTIEFMPFDELRAPIEQGDKIGDIAIRLGDRQLATTAAIAAEPVARGNWWRRIIDAIKLFFVNRAS